MAKAIESSSLEDQFSSKCSLKTSESENKPLECVPLLLSDVLRCKATSSPTIFQVFNGALLFRTIILHARVVGKVLPSNNNSLFRFEVDDCTSVVPLILRKKREDIDEVQRLQNEVSARRAGKQRKDILDAVQRLLDKTRKQQDPSCISVGNKILIFGKPDLYRDRISIFGFSWDLDKGSDRNMELCFKDELIEWYTNKYPRLKN